MSEINDKTTIQLPTFDGDRDKHLLWDQKMMCYAVVKKFAQALGDAAEPDLPASDATVIDETTDIGKRQAAAKQRNSIAMACLTMAFTTDAAMSVVFKAKTIEWPGGLAWKVMDLMRRKYRPQDLVTRAELRNKLNNLSMADGDDPKILFEEISTIENRYNIGTNRVDEADLIALVMQKAPKMYKSVIAAQELRLGNALTLTDLESAMDKLYRVMDNDVEGSGNELQLSAFAGKCYKCKKPGHMAKDCKNSGKPSTSNNKNNSNSTKDSKKFSGKCFNCGKTGHKSADCWQKEENKHKRPKGYNPSGANNETGGAAVDNGSKVEFLLCGFTKESPKSFPDNQALLNDPNIWIGDTGATTHMKKSDSGMVNIRKASESDAVTMGNKQVEATTKVGDVYGTICDKYGNEVSRVGLMNVSHVPGAGYNLFSLSRMIGKEGWKLVGDKHAIVIEKNGHRVKFDILISTPKGVAYAMYLKEDTEVAGAVQDKPKEVKINIAQAHKRFGHMGEDATRKAAKALGITITPGSLGPCESCAAGKAKQKNLPKSSYDDEPKAKEENIVRAFTDIASLKNHKGKPTVTYPHWSIVVIDEEIQLKVSNFYKSKDAMVEPLCERMNRWKESGRAITNMRLDNAGENKWLKKRSDSKDWKLGIKFEFTARDTPQQNSIAEVAFSTIADRGRAMMHDANLDEKERYLLYRYAFDTATKLDGLVQVTKDGMTQSRYKHWCQEEPAWAKHLRTFGEAGTIKIKTDTTPKPYDKGVQCIFVGYSDDHAGDCYLMWDPKTKRMHSSRDVIWLRRMYYEKPDMKREISPTIDFELEIPETKQPETIEVGEGNGGVSSDDETTTMAEKNEAETTAATITTRSGRAVNPPRKLIEEMGNITKEYEIGLTQAEINYHKAMGKFPYGNDSDVYRPGEFACVGAGVGGGFKSTEELHVMKYDEAMAGPDKDKWKQAVKEEHERMVKSNVFEMVPRKDVPEGSKILTSTWAMKKKASGVYRARMNARGYEQVDGEHYDANRKSAPVVSAATIRIFFILAIMAEWIMEIMDVKGAFLLGEFEDGHKMFLEVPQGFEEYYPKDCVLLLLKTLYGTIQAAMAFWKKLCEAFKNMKHKRSKADPCLYFAWTEVGLVLWISWVDDLAVAGKPKAVATVKKKMKKEFDCDDQGELKEYIGCKVDRDMENGSIKLTQPVLMQSYEDEFDLPKHEQIPRTPAVPGQVLKSGEPMEPQKQSKYRSGVGKLMHMVNRSRPEMLNSVRELSRWMMTASAAHMKAMYRAMIYAVNTPNRGVLLKPNAKWNGDPSFEFEITGKADSDYGKDPERHRSVSGYATFLNGAPVTEKSRMQTSVTLSVTEAEFVSGCQAAQDMLFGMRVLESIGLKVKKPMLLELDNKGAVDLSHNWSVSGRLCHDSIRQSFLRELEEEGMIEVKWIPGNENSADLFTKNLATKNFEKHTMEYCGYDEYMDLD